MGRAEACTATSNAAAIAALTRRAPRLRGLFDDIAAPLVIWKKKNVRRMWGYVDRDPAR